MMEGAARRAAPSSDPLLSTTRASTQTDGFFELLFIGRWAARGPADPAASRDAAAAQATRFSGAAIHPAAARSEPPPVAIAALDSALPALCCSRARGTRARAAQRRFRIDGLVDCP